MSIQVGKIFANCSREAAKECSPQLSLSLSKGASRGWSMENERTQKDRKNEMA